LAARRSTFFQPRGDDITQQQQEEEAKEAGGGGAIRDGGDGGDDDGGDDDDDGDDFGDNEDDDAMPPADDEDDEAADDEDHAGQHATVAAAPRRNSNQNAAGRNRTDREPTLEDPLPGVNMSNTPQMFRLGIGEIMHELRKNCKEEPNNQISTRDTQQGQQFFLEQNLNSSSLTLLCCVKGRQTQLISCVLTLPEQSSLH